MSELRSWLWLAQSGVSPMIARRCLRAVGSVKELFLCDPGSLRGVEGLRAGDLRALANKDISGAESIEEHCRKTGVRILCLQDADYPDRLRSIEDPPVVIYIKGKLPPVDDRLTIGIVGTRKASAYGREMAESIGRELAEAGAVVVTGLAEGIDSAAAKGALQGPGAVIAVLGTSTDKVYPAWNGKLQGAVEKSGALVSEYPPGTGPTRGSFPQRNRIISGLSLGITVVQAPQKSGSLITAARAQEHGRDVFAVPGMANDAGFAGSHALIRDGAQLVCSGEDILEEYRFRFPQLLALRDGRQVRNSRREAPQPALDKAGDVGYHALKEQLEELTETELELVGLLAGGEKHSDDLIAAAGRDPGEVITSLVMLQLKGYVAEEDHRYRLLVS